MEVSGSSIESASPRALFWVFPKARSVILIVSLARTVLDEVPPIVGWWAGELPIPRICLKLCSGNLTCPPSMLPNKNSCQSALLRRPPSGQLLSSPDASVDQVAESCPHPPLNVSWFIDLLENPSPTNIGPLLLYVHSGLLPIGMIIDRVRMAVRLRPSLCG